MDRLKRTMGLSALVEEQMRSREGVLLTTKLDKLGVGDQKFDFYISLSHATHLDRLEGYRETLVMLKDLLVVTKVEELDWPKSYHLKTAMANVMRERRWGEDGRQPASREELLRQTLSRTISAYKRRHLPSYFDGRINLLLDLRQPGEQAAQRRRRAIERMERILRDYDKLLEECRIRPMVLSGLIMGMAKVRRILR